ncbi:MAG: TlpA family protein disulfide reductase [Roseivirga sp.]|nr:TlpA family protein disulfide reductase [Roseivirga sp.]
MKTSLMIVLALCVLDGAFAQKKGVMSQDQYYELLGREYDMKLENGTMNDLKNARMNHRGLNGERFTAKEADSLKLLGQLKLVDTKVSLLGRLTAYYEYVNQWEGTRLPYFDAEDEYGNIYNADKLKGKVVVINLWYMGCSWCLFEIPELNEVVESFEGKPVEFLALGRDKLGRIHAFLKKRNMEFKYSLIRPTKAIYDFGDNYVLTGWPGHIIINPDGVIEYLWSGNTTGKNNLKSSEVLKARIGEVLRKFNLNE